MTGIKSVKAIWTREKLLEVTWRREDFWCVRVVHQWSLSLASDFRQRHLHAQIHDGSDFAKDREHGFY